MVHTPSQSESARQNGEMEPIALSRVLHIALAVFAPLHFGRAQQPACSWIRSGGDGRVFHTFYYARCTINLPGCECDVNNRLGERKASSQCQRDKHTHTLPAVHKPWQVGGWRVGGGGAEPRLLRHICRSPAAAHNCE